MESGYRMAMILAPGYLLRRLMADRLTQVGVLQIIASPTSEGRGPPPCGLAYRYWRNMEHLI